MSFFLLQVLQNKIARQSDLNTLLYDSHMLYIGYNEGWVNSQLQAQVFLQMFELKGYCPCIWTSVRVPWTIQRSWFLCHIYLLYLLSKWQIITIAQTLETQSTVSSWLDKEKEAALK